MARAFKSGDDFVFTRPVIARGSARAGGRDERNVGHVLIGVSGAELQEKVDEVRNVILGLLSFGGLLLARSSTTSSRSSCSARSRR